MTACIAQNYPGTEEANAGQNSLNNPSNRIRVRTCAFDLLAQYCHRHDCGPERYERMRADSRSLAVKLAICSQNSTDERRDQKTEDQPIHAKCVYIHEIKESQNFFRNLLERNRMFI